MNFHLHEGVLVLGGIPLWRPFGIMEPAGRRLSLSSVLLLPLQPLTNINSGCFNDAHDCHQYFHALL
jgi:hypothetical protein